MTNNQQEPDAFTPAQEAMLHQPLDMSLIKHRRGGGNRLFPYVTGKSVIDAANRIFGYGKWGYKILHRSHERCGDENKGEIEYYTADIELSVIGAAFPFPGDGVGIVTAPYTVEIHEKARKEAVTDALKRALRHYGDQFGLCLYSEDDYVQASDGSLIQVKAVPVNDGKNKPRQVVEAGATKAIAAPALSEQVKHLKERALALNLAHNSEEWAMLLHSLHLDTIASAADVTTVSDHLAGLEAMHR